MQASQIHSIGKFALTLSSAFIGSFMLNSCGTNPVTEEFIPIPEPITIPTPDETPDDILPDPVEQPGNNQQEEVAPVIPRIPTAKLVPGRPGFVFNPFTQNMVDVDGIPSGTKVRDPQDSDESHVFKVP